MEEGGLSGEVCMNIEDSRKRERCKNQDNFGFYVIGFIRNYFFFFL